MVRNTWTVDSRCCETAVGVCALDSLTVSIGICAAPYMASSPKEQLFERIVDEKFATMSRSMFAIMGDPKLPIVERIIGGVATHFDFVAENPLLPRFIINEIVARPERYEVFYKRAGVVIETICSLK